MIRQEKSINFSCVPISYKIDYTSLLLPSIWVFYLIYGIKATLEHFTLQELICLKGEIWINSKKNLDILPYFLIYEYIKENNNLNYTHNEAITPFYIKPYTEININKFDFFSRKSFLQISQELFGYGTIGSTQNRLIEGLSEIFLSHGVEGAYMDPLRNLIHKVEKTPYPIYITFCKTSFTILPYLLGSSASDQMIAQRIFKALIISMNENTSFPFAPADFTLFLEMIKSMLGIKVVEKLFHTIFAIKMDRTEVTLSLKEFIGLHKIILDQKLLEVQIIDEKKVNLTTLGTKVSDSKLVKNLIESIFSNDPLWLDLIKESKYWIFDGESGIFQKAFVDNCAKVLNEITYTSNTPVIFESAMNRILLFFPFIKSAPVTFAFENINNHKIIITIPDNPLILQFLQEEGLNFTQPQLMEKVFPIFFKIKKLEIDNLLMNSNKNNISDGRIDKPCLMVYEENRNIKADLLKAVFIKGQLIGLIPDSEFAEKELKSQGYLDTVVEEDGYRKGVYTLEQFSQLNQVLASSNEKIPPILILESLASKTSVKPSSSKKGIKRNLSEGSAEKKAPAKKRAKMDSISLLPNSSVSSGSSRSAISQVSIPKVTNLLPLVGDQFWKNLNLNTVEKVSGKVKEKQNKLSLSEGKPYSYPILDLLHKPAEEYSIIPMHPLLKPYQIKEVQTQLDLFQKGISRLLSFEMGLGKTYVMAEILSQLIFKGTQGLYIFIAPKSVTPQIAEELSGYLAQIISIAWAHRFHHTEEKGKKNIITNCTKSLFEAMEKESAEIVFSLLPLLSYMQVSELYDLMMQKGALEENKKGIWDKVRKLCDKLLSSIEPELFIELQNRLEVNNFFISKERGALEALKKAKESKVSYWGIGDEVENIRFKPPLLCSQLVWTAKMIRYFYDKKKIKIGNLEKFPEGLHHLTRFPLHEIQIAKNTTEITERLTSGIGIVVTHHQAFCCLAVNKMEEFSIGGIFIDEAQKIHTSKAQNSKLFFQLTSAAKRKNPRLPLLLATATPFENNFGELWTLLKIANPLANSFEKNTFDSMQKNIQSIQIQLSDQVLSEEESNEFEMEPLIQELIITFAHLEAFRQKILIPLTANKKMQDVDVQESWQYKTPERAKEPVVAILSELAQKTLSNTHQKYASKILKNFQYKNKIKLILLHPQFENSAFTENDPKINEIENLLKDKKIVPEKKREWIDSSPLIANLIHCKSFEKAIQNKHSGLIFADHIKTSSILKLALEFISSKEQPLEVKVFTGEQDSNEKEAVLRWFKTPESHSKFLIAMKKSGSVGLNLPEADYVFFPSGNDWNPSVDKQAAARAIRINSTGIKTIVNFKYDIFMHYHTKAIRSVKKAMESFFHVGPSKGIREQFNAFIQVLLSQFYHANLNESNNQLIALQRMKSFEELLTELVNNIEDEQLHASLESVMPSKQ